MYKNALSSKPLGQVPDPHPQTSEIIRQLKRYLKVHKRDIAILMELPSDHPLLIELAAKLNRDGFTDHPYRMPWTPSRLRYFVQRA